MTHPRPPGPSRLPRLFSYPIETAGYCLRYSSRIPVFKPRPQLLMLWAVAVLARTSVSDAQSTASAAPTPPRVSEWTAAGIWGAAQLVPSPLLVTSTNHVGGGARWQLTPLLYSFGITSHPWRSFVVPPIVRHSGSVELYGSPEWACCARLGHSSWIARAGARVYVPLIDKGELLSASFGGSYYRGGGERGGAAEVGIYTLFGVIGITVTLAPALTRREVITALSIRYF